MLTAHYVDANTEDIENLIEEISSFEHPVSPALLECFLLRHKGSTEEALTSIEELKNMAKINGEKEKISYSRYNSKIGAPLSEIPEELKNIGEENVEEETTTPTRRDSEFEAQSTFDHWIKESNDILKELQNVEENAREEKENGLSQLDSKVGSQVDDVLKEAKNNGEENIEDKSKCLSQLDLEIKDSTDEDKQPDCDSKEFKTVLEDSKQLAFENQNNDIHNND